MTEHETVDTTSIDDRTLAALFASRDEKGVLIITERNNQRLFRVAWSILKNRSEAEDVVQSTYLRAFSAITAYEGRASLSTWLTRIAINEALERKRKTARRREKLDPGSVIVLQEYRDKLMNGSNAHAEPDREAAREQIRQVLEEAIARIAGKFRIVFVLRGIEQLSVAEVAEALGIPEATVKTRFLRARRMLQKELDADFKHCLSGTFPFAGADCAAMTKRILGSLTTDKQKSHDLVTRRVSISGSQDRQQ